MAAKTGIHWLAPTTMIGANVAGFLLALGHHLFYRSLQGTAVSDGDIFGLGISEQQANTAVGTAFAFLVKACLVLAISIAFVQIFWHAASAPSREEAPMLGRIDAVMSTLDNVLEMFNFRSWRRFPLLMIVGGLTWLVPIASIITPSTLSIRTAKVLPPQTISSRVPSLDFRSLNYLAQMPETQMPSLGSYQGHQPYYYAYSGASDDLLRITNAVMGNGAILPITPPATNTSWQLEFHGPSLECRDVDAELVSDFSSRLNEFLQPLVLDRQYGYVAWYPDDESEKVSIPISRDGMKSAHSNGSSPADVLDLGSLVPPATDASLNRSSKALEMLIFTTAFPSSADYRPSNDSALKLRKCQLFNSTYQVLFDYSDGRQNITAAVARNSTEEPIQHIPGALTKYMDQSTDGYIFPCSGPEASDLRCCYNNPALLQTLAYQSIFDAFAKSFDGEVYLDNIKYQNANGAIGSAVYVESDLMETKLAQSKDLAYLRKVIRSPPSQTEWPTFQAVVEANQSSVVGTAAATRNESTADFVGTYTTMTEEAGSEMLLSDAIEELFKNLTVSLMSSAALQPNSSSPTAPSPAMVTYHNYHNIYVYSARKLWLPYGIALGLSTLAVLVGLMTMFLNRASYSYSFSTVLRAAHGAQLSAELLDEDSRGQDPLPKYLAEAQVWLRGGKTNGASSPSSQREGPPPVPHKEARSTVKLLGGDGQAESLGPRSRNRT